MSHARDAVGDAACGDGEAKHAAAGGAGALAIDAIGGSRTEHAPATYAIALAVDTIGGAAEGGGPAVHASAGDAIAQAVDGVGGAADGSVLRPDHCVASHKALYHRSRPQAEGIGCGGEGLARAEGSVTAGAAARPHSHLQPQGGPVEDAPEVQLDGEQAVDHVDIVQGHGAAHLGAGGGGVEEQELEVVGAVGGAAAVLQAALVGEGGAGGGEEGRGPGRAWAAGAQQGAGGLGQAGGTGRQAEGQDEESDENERAMGFHGDSSKAELAVWPDRR